MNFCEGQSVGLSCRFNPSLSYLNFSGTYQWQKDGKNIPNATEQYYHVKEAGSYTLAIQLGSCNAISAPVKINYNLVLSCYKRPVYRSFFNCKCQNN